MIYLIELYYRRKISVRFQIVFLIDRFPILSLLFIYLIFWRIV